MRRLTAATILALGLLAVTAAPAAAQAAPTPFERQLSLAAQQRAVKILVNHDGWYRVSRAELTRAGLEQGADAKLLQLYADGRQVPILLRGVRGGRLAPDGWIEFYGRQRNLTTTQTRTYWLVVGSSSGRRIEIVPRPARPRSAGPRSFEHTIVSKERSQYYSWLLDEGSNFFGQYIRPQPALEKLNVHHLDPRATRAALEVSVKGFSLLPHEVKVSLNGTDLGVMKFEGQKRERGRFAIPASLLKDGENTVALASLKGDTDVSLVDELRLTYGHLYEADGNTLEFPVHARKAVRVSGFGQASVRVADITNADSVRVLRPHVSRSGPGYVIALKPAAKFRRLLATAHSAMKRPAAVMREQASNWYSAERGADLVIVSHRDFIGALEPLKALRERQGMKVVVADVDDLFDEFTYGAHRPEAIQRFLMRARERWKPAPRFLLLVGDATADPLDLLDKGKNDFVPSKMIDTKYSETASDDWFADFNDDGLPEMSVGRIPVRTAAQASTVVRKIVSYEEVERPADERWALFVADSNDKGYNFERVNTTLRDVLAPKMTVDLLHRGRSPSAASDASVRQNLLAKLNRGPSIVNFFGHGSPVLWTDGSILRAPDADSLRNGDRLSFYVMTTCNNGYFIDVTRTALGEGLLRAEGGGAVAVWASSGYTEAYPQSILNEELYRLHVADPSLTLGELLTRTKRATDNADIRRTFILHGDPTMRLR